MGPEELQGQVHQERLFRAQTGKNEPMPRGAEQQLRIIDSPPRNEPYHFKPRNSQLALRYSRVHIIFRQSLTFDTALSWFRR